MKLRQPITEQELRSAAETSLGRRIPEHVWQALRRHINTCLDEDLTPEEYEQYFDRLLDAADVALAVARRELRSPQKTDEGERRDGNLEAVVAAQVAEAKRHPDVQWLWCDVFEGNLFSPGEDPATFLTEAAQRCGGTLAGLSHFISQLAGELAQRYHWPVAAARQFLLTGQPPYIPRFRMSVQWQPDYPLLSTIQIETNIGLRPKELAKAFGEYQRSVFRFYGLRDRQKQRRALSPKHSALGAFAASRRDKSGKDAMAEWNASHPEWRYDDVKRFQRDRQAALRRLFGIQRGDRGNEPEA